MNRTEQIELHKTLLGCRETGVSADNYVRIHVTDTNITLKCMREFENENSFFGMNFRATEVV